MTKGRDILWLTVLEAGKSKKLASTSPWLLVWAPWHLHSKQEKARAYMQKSTCARETEGMCQARFKTAVARQAENERDKHPSLSQVSK